MLVRQARRQQRVVTKTEEAYNNFIKRMEDIGECYAMCMGKYLKEYSIGYLKVLKAGATMTGNYIVASVIGDVIRNKAQYGKWWPEDDMKLQRLVIQHGTNWYKIGILMDRHPDDCETRYGKLYE